MTYNYKALANEVIARGIDLFSTFDEWTKGAFALSTLGNEGRDIFLAISQLSPNFDERENLKKFNNALQTNSRIGIGTFIHQCQQAGIYTKQFFIADDGKKTRLMRPVTIPHAPKSTSYIPFKYVEESFPLTSSFVEFLFLLFDDKTILAVAEDYLLGATQDGGTIFWEIDTKGKVRTGKIIYYSPETGHRIKAKKAQWVHYLLKQKGVLSADFNLHQCLFGEHLLHRYPHRTVAVVEAEKTAIICAAVFTQYVWLATGGMTMLSHERMKVCEGRKVIFFPDTDPEGKTFQLWQEKAKEFTFCKCVVSDLLERCATPDEKAKKIDIADLLIRQLLESPLNAEPQQTEQEKLLGEMKDTNPALSVLIDTFDLQLIA